MNNNRKCPPKFFESFLKWFCRSDFFEEISGDLHEIYLEESIEKGYFIARVKYFIRFLTFLKFSNIAFNKPNTNAMLFKNYLLIAFRNILKYKNHASFNLLGLIIGFTASILMIKYVTDELSYDQQYDNYENIYRVAQHVDMEQSEMTAAISPGPLGSTLKKELPEIDATASFSFFNSMTLKVNEEQFNNSKAYYASKSFFEVFDYEFISGNPQIAFKEPKSVVLSQSAAIRYFGTTDVLGQSVEDTNAGSLKITGIFKDIPKNSHFRPEILYYLDRDLFIGDNWTDHSYYTFIKLKEGNDLSSFQDKLPAFTELYLKQSYREAFGGIGHLFLQPISDIHLFSNISFEISTNNSYRNVMAMLFLAIFITIVVCINYTNMATAQSTRRVKEIGVRKVMGSGRQMILTQFFTESILITSIAAILGGIVLPFILPLFNYLSDKSFTYEDFITTDLIIYYLAITFLTAFLGAVYPAFFLSRFKTDEILRKSYSFGKFKLPVNKLLNAFQFSVALIMIIITLTVYQQIEYAKNMDLGFDKENIFKIDLKHRPGTEHANTIKQELLTHHSIVNASIARQVPGDRIMSDGLFFESPTGEFTNIKSAFNGVDENFINTIKLDLIAGRNFTDQTSDIMGKTVIVNEEVAKNLGYTNPSDILGKKVKLPLGENHTASIIGVIKNAHLESLHNKVLPSIMVHFIPMGSQLLVKVKNDNLWETHDFIDHKITEMTNSSSHTITFLDDAYWEQYQADEKRSNILSLFSILIILLAISGLIGLISFQVRNQAKEISIRKVFGAAFHNISSLYIKQYVWQIGFSILFAIPFAIYLIQEWLTNFAYHISMPYWLMILAPLCLATSVVLLIILKIRMSFNGNPAELLKEN